MKLLGTMVDIYKSAGGHGLSGRRNPFPLSIIHYKVNQKFGSDILGKRKDGGPVRIFIKKKNKIK